ncbi:MAG: glycosyltransferase family 4 protein [Candidatus Merdousia sp.]|nr:glycosyltransferase family 4 protein [Candidatus Merdousia sp.]
MKILHISAVFSIGNGGIYSDLGEALVSGGHSVDVLLADASLRFCDKPSWFEQNGVSILRVPTFKMQKMGIVKKSLAFVLLPFILKRALKKFLSQKNYDLIIFDAPPITLTPVVASAKKLFKCPVFLMQKDIFPQNAVDVGLFPKCSPVYWYFRRQERKMLALADKIGCMSQGNIDYIRKHNPYIDAEKVVYFPNAVKVNPFVRSDGRTELCRKFGIPQNACIFLYGGNMGIPQYMQLTAAAIRHFKNDSRVYFMCIGSGTKAGIIKDAIASANPSNAAYYSAIPRADYDLIARNCDVGIVTLSPYFTIPNYPSKSLGYMAAALPILAATDTNTDFRALVDSQAKCGIWCASSDENAFFEAIQTLASNADLRSSFGANGRKYFERNFDAAVWAKRLVELFIA